jgi:hypothetical protein
VHGVGEALEERFNAGRAGADQPREFTGACPVCGEFQRAHFFDCQVVIEMVFHAS